MKTFMRRMYQHGASWYRWLFPSEQARIWVSRVGFNGIALGLSLLLIFSTSTLSAFASGVYTSSAVDGDGNTLLSSNTVNDTQTYDTSQDSSPATQQQLGVDPNWTNGVTRQSGALRFDGSNDYVSTAYNSAYDFGAGAVFTVSAWVNLQATPASNMGILGNANYQTCGYTLYVDSGRNAYLRVDTAGVEGGGTIGIVPLNKWTLLTVTMDSAGLIRTYLNGAAGPTAVANITTCGGGRQFFIGNSKQGLPSYFNGYIDDVRLYSRALSSAEVTNVYNRQSVSDTNLVDWWKLDDSTGTSALDSSPSSDTGTLLNGSGNSPVADGLSNGPVWTSGADAIMDGFKGCGPEDTTCVNPSNRQGAGNVSVTPDSSTTSTNSYDAQVVNAPALTFDGDDAGNPDSVTFSNNTAADIGTGSMTWSTWFKSTMTVTGILYRKSDSNFVNGFGWAISGTGTLSADLNGGTITTNSTGALNDGKWHNAVSIYNRSTQKLSLYVDGVLNSTADASSIGASALNSTAIFELGGVVGGCGSNCYFAGSLSDMRIWSRPLGPQEVTAIYNNQPVSNLNLSAWWKLSEGTGTLVKDYSGNAITGTLSNAAGPAANGTTNGPIWAEGPSFSSATGSGASSSTPNWALPGYAYRQPMKVNNSSGSILPTGYAVTTSTTFGSLLNANQARSDGKDVRVVYQPTDTVRSLSISGTQYASIPDSPSLDPSSAISFGAWVKETTVNNFVDYMGTPISGKSSVAYSLGRSSSNSIVCKINIAGSLTTLSNGNFPTTGQWAFYFCTYDGSTMKDYRNGVQIGSASVSGAIASTSGESLGLGSNCLNGNVNCYGNMSGSIDDARVYNRGLTASDVTALYNNGAGTPGAVSSGLVGWWRLDEGSGQIVADSSGSGNNGYLGTSTGSDTTDPTWNSTAGNGTPDGAVSTTYEIPRNIPHASALTFDGTATKAAISNPAADQVAMPQGTISTWVNRTTHDNTDRAIYDVAGTGNNGLVLFGDTAAGGGVTADDFRLQYGTGSTTKNIVSPGVPSDNTWYNIVITWNASGAQMFLNGSSVASNTSAPSITLGSNSYLGSNGGTIRFFAGSIGETRLYNEALTPAQIAAMYSGASTTLLAPQKNLIEGWRADEGTGTTLNDASGVGANATVTIGSGSWLLNQAPTVSSQTTNFQTVAPIASSGSSSDYYLYYGNPTETGSALTTPVTSKTELNFDGASGAAQDDNLIVPASSSVNNLGTFTWSGWINATSAGTTNLSRIFDKGYRLIQFNGGSLGKIIFTQYFASGQNIWQTTNPVIVFGTWQLVTLTYDSSSTANTPILYINGTSVPLTETLATGSGAITSDTAQPLNIGNRTGNDRTFDGNFDDARVYNRILSSTEVSDLYNFGNTPPISSTGLVGWWKMDETSGTSALDSSGNSNTGTLTNFNFNNTSGWKVNPNLFQAASVTTANVGTASVNAPRYFQWRADTGPLTFGAWQPEQPIQSGPVTLGATGVKLVWNMNGSYARYDTVHVASWVVQAFSSTRGKKRSLPQKTSIISDGTAGGTTGSLDIIDASTNLLWMRIAAGGSTQFGTVPNKITALNGKIYLSAGGQVREVDFQNDVFHKYASTGNSLGSTTIANQASTSSYGTASGTTFSATSSTGIAAAVIGTTPPKQDVAVATNSGINVVFNETSSGPMVATSTDSPVYNFVRVASDSYAPVALTSGGSLYGGDVTSGGFDRWDGLATTAANVTGATNTTATYRVIGTTTAANSISPLQSDTVNALSVSPGQSSSDYVSNAVAVGTSAGVDLVNENTTLANTTANHYVATGNSGTSGWNSNGFGGAIQTSGSTYVNVPTSTTLDPGVSDFTVEGWFKTSASCASSCNIFQRRTGGSASPGYAVYLNSSNKLVTSFSTLSGEVAITSIGTVNDGVWHHFALVRTTQTTETQYLDGVQQQTTTNANINGSIVISSALGIGCVSGGSSCFTGQIDDVRISNLARYTAAFSPQKTEFTADANTVGIWHFDEPNGQYATDSSGNNNTGTLGATSSVGADDALLISPSLGAASTSVTNVAATGITPSTDQGEGLSFNGTSQFVSTATQTPFNFSNQTFTVSAWFNTIAVAQGVIVAADGSAGGWALSISSSGKIATTVKNGSNVVVINASTGGTFNDGKWHFAVMELTTSTTVAGNNVATFYVDGVPQGSLTGSVNTYGVPASPLTIGERAGGTPIFFSGSLDDVRVYSGALSPASVGILYNGGRGWNGGKDANLVAGYTMNEGTGQTVSDYSGNSYTGTLGATNAASSDDPTWISSTPVRSQSSLWTGTHLSGTGNDGGVSDISLTSNRQLRSYTNSNSLMPGSDVTSLSVGTTGLGLVGTAEGAWNPGENGTVIDDPIALTSETVSSQLNSGTIQLNSGTIQFISH